MGRALLRAANRTECQAVIAEISHAELRFGGRSPQEFSADLLAATVRGGYCGSVFMQGYHYQVSPSAYSADHQAELSALRDLIRSSPGAFPKTSGRASGSFWRTASFVLFQKLDVVGSAGTIEKFVKPVSVTLKRPKAMVVQQPSVGCTRLDNACIGS